MTKLRKMMMMLVFVVAVILGITAGTGNAKAATTKNFKGNLNVTYKNSKEKSKITIKRVDSKKVSIKIVIDGDDWGSFNGKIISKNTIKLTDFPNVKFKWEDKTNFISIRKGNGFGEAAKMIRRVCYALNNTKYTQIQKGSTVYYYGANRANGEEGEFYSNNPLFEKAIIKGNKLIITGTLMGSKDKNKAFYKGKFYDYKKRTFKLTNNTKYYQMASEMESRWKRKI